MSKGNPKSQSVDLSPSYHDKEHAEKKFHENYEFTKGLPARSVSDSAWYNEAVQENSPFMDISPKEHALVTGKMHGFGHKGAQMQGALRMSGTKGAHRIGAKRK